MLALFGDVATELLIRHDGDEGLFRAYDAVEFLAPGPRRRLRRGRGRAGGGRARPRGGCGSRRGRSSSPRPRPLGQRRRCAGGAGGGVPGQRDLRRTRRRSSGGRDDDGAGREPGAGGEPQERDAVIITAAVVGAEVTRAQSPHVPVHAGARSRRPRWTPGAPAPRWSTSTRAGRTDGRRRSRRTSGRSSTASAPPRCDVVVQCSTGGAVGMSVDERLGSLVDGAEMATLNLGTMNFGDDVFVNARPDIVRIAARIRERAAGAGVRGLRRRACSTRCAGSSRRDTCRRPTTSSSCWACRAACAANERNLRFLVEGLPEPAHWTVAGVGRAQLEMACAGAARSAATSAWGSRTTCTSRRASWRRVPTCSSSEPSP